MLVIKSMLTGRNRDMTPMSAHIRTCCQALTFLLCWEDLGVSQTAVGDIPDPKAEHRMRQQELRHGCESGFALLQVLPQLHHVQDLTEERRQIIHVGHITFGLQKWANVCAVSEEYRALNNGPNRPTT